MNGKQGGNTPTTTSILTSSVEAIPVFMGRDEKRKKTREMTRPGLLREEKTVLSRKLNFEDHSWLSTCDPLVLSEKKEERK
jgi:hypothetical protein